MACATTRSPRGCGAGVMSSRSGESGSTSNASPVSKIGLGVVDRWLFPPQVRAEVIRLACERPADSDVPLTHWSANELELLRVMTRGICEQISGMAGLALALPRRDQTVAVPLLDLPARSRVHREGRPDP